MQSLLQSNWAPVWVCLWLYSWVFSTAGETCKLCQALMCRTQIESFLIVQIITPHSLQDCFSRWSDWFNVRHFREEKFCEWAKCFSFIAISLWFGRRSGKTRINPINSQEKELKVCGSFCRWDTVYPLNWSIYASKFLGGVSKAQSYMQVKEKGHAISFPPAHPFCTLLNYFLCSYK